MKWIIFPLMLWSLLWAENPQKISKEILEKTSQKYLSSTSLQGDFKYVLIDKIKKKDLVKTGNFKIKGEKYRLTLENPDMIIFFNGKKRVSYRVAEKEYEYLEDEENIFNMQEVLKNYETNYRYHLAKEVEVNGKMCYVMVLKPKAQAQEEHDLEHSKVQVELFISKNTYEIQKMVTQEANERQIILEVFTLKSNEPLKDQQFDFKPEDYPGAEQI